MKPAQGAARGRHRGFLDVVLQRDGDAVQGSADLARFPLLIQGARLGQGARVHRDGRVDHVLIGRDADQVLPHQFLGGDATFRHRLSHVRDRGLDDAEGRPRRGRRLLARPEDQCRGGE
jgi:hypothetical protein